MITLVRNKRYRFKFNAPAIIQSEMVGVVKGVSLDYSVVQPITDVAHLHATALPSLPAGTPTDPKDLNYVLVADKDGNSLAFAYEWLRETPEEIGGGLAVIQLTGVTQSDLPTIRALLASGGFTVTDASVS
jgi:hypothetical protein